MIYKKFVNGKSYIGCRFNEIPLNEISSKLKELAEKYSIPHITYKADYYDKESKQDPKKHPVGVLFDLLYEPYNFGYKRFLFIEVSNHDK